MINAKTRLIMSFIFYINVIILSLFISHNGLNNINAICLITPYIFMVLSVHSFWLLYEKTRLKYGFLIILKVSIIFTGYLSGQYEILSYEHIIFFIVQILLILISGLLEYLFYIHCETKNNFDKLDIPVELEEEIDILMSKDKEINNKYEQTKKIAYSIRPMTINLFIVYLLVCSSTISSLKDIYILIVIIFGIISFFIAIWIIYRIYMDFIRTSKRNIIKGLLIIFISIAPFSLFFFPNFAYQISIKGFAFLLYFFSIPLEILYHSEAKKIRENFIKESKILNIMDDVN